jgi:hypothetical protein
MKPNVEKVVGLVRQFFDDLITVYPEYNTELNALRTETVEESEALYVHCMGVYPPNFMSILYKDSSMFTEEAQFLPGVDFKELFKKCDVETSATIWKYLQLILFCLIEDQGEKDMFGESSGMLCDAMMNEEMREKLKETVSELGKKDESGDQFAEMFNEIRDNVFDGSNSDVKFDSIHENLEKMFNGKIGSLAKEIAHETFADGEGEACAEFAKLFEESENPSKVMEMLLKNPAKMMGLVQSIGTKLDGKLKSGELKESELLEEASNMLGCMKNMPGMGDILGKMGAAKSGAQKKLKERQASVSDELGTAKSVIEENQRQVAEMQQRMQGMQSEKKS